MFRYILLVLFLFICSCSCSLNDTNGVVLTNYTDTVVTIVSDEGKDREFILTSYLYMKNLNRVDVEKNEYINGYMGFVSDNVLSEINTSTTNIKWFEKWNTHFKNSDSISVSEVGVQTPVGLPYPSALGYAIKIYFPNDSILTDRMITVHFEPGLKWATYGSRY